MVGTVPMYDAIGHLEKALIDITAQDFLEVVRAHAADGVDLGANYMDCGVLIYDLKAQDAHCGGSGCGCSASVLCGHFLRGMRDGLWRRVLFAATGALMSPTVSQQGESIPSVCHAAAIESERC